jgi:hypothetical protein
MKTSRILVTALTFALASCVSHQGSASDWPKPVALKSLSQLGGVYANKGQGGGTYGRKLYDLIDGQLHISDKRGERTELRPAADGKTIHVLLRDGKGKLLQSKVLREKDDFIVEKSGLSVKVPSNIGETGVGNLGVFVGDASVVVRPSANGGLLGEESEFGAGFFGFMIPIAASKKENYYWPVLGR